MKQIIGNDFHAAMQNKDVKKKNNFENLIVKVDFISAHLLKALRDSPFP